MDYKTGKWAKQIIDLQLDDGTTEQALRRLEILGFSIEDKPIQKALNYLNDCLIGKKKIPDREEKTHNWKVFLNLMLSTWIRRFTNENQQPSARSRVRGRARYCASARYVGSALVLVFSPTTHP